MVSDSYRWTRIILYSALLATASNVRCKGDPFTLVVLPDTQEYVKSDALNLGFEAQTAWIVDNAQERNIKFVTQVGDIVSDGGGGLRGDSNQAQWDRANRAMSTLDPLMVGYPHGIPWGTAVGNHELDEVDVVTSGFSQWKAHFGAATTGRFDDKPWFGGTSPNDLNTYQSFRANGRDYLMMHLELDVPDHAIAWAQSVLIAHPDQPTIISTHVYEGTAFGPPNNPYLANPGRNSQLQIFDKLIADNSQIFMVVSGHTGEERNRVRLNREGLPVFQLVQDYASRPNGGDGWMRLLELDEEAGEVRVHTYTPGVSANPQARYERDCNSDLTLPLDWGVRFDGQTAPAPGPSDELAIPASLVDDFSKDSAAAYELSQSFGSGGTFSVADDVLNVSPGSNNTVSVMLDDGVHFLPPGYRVAVDVLDDGNSFFQVSTIPSQPDGRRSFGFRLRRDTQGFRIHRYSENQSTLTDFVCDPGGQVTLWIDRLSDSDFEFYFETEGERTLIGEATLAEGADNDNLHFGVQAFTSLPTIRFDNLRVMAVPEPGPKPLVLLGLLGQAIIARRAPRLKNLASAGGDSCW